jgi:hypothetical protein
MAFVYNPESLYQFFAEIGAATAIMSERRNSMDNGKCATCKAKCGFYTPEGDKEARLYAIALIDFRQQ